MPYILGLAGQARAGKDSAADYLVQRLNDLSVLKSWIRGSLAHSVKKIFAENFGVSLEFIEEWKTKTEIPEGFNAPIRDGLTKIGDGWRDMKHDIWMSKLFEHNDRNLVVSDVRYINETNAIRGKSDLKYMNRYKGITALIWRPGHENNKQSRSEQELMPFVNALKEQPSGPIENTDIPFDLWLRNNGTLDQWHDKVDKIVIPFASNIFSPNKLLLS